MQPFAFACCGSLNVTLSGETLCISLDENILQSDQWILMRQRDRVQACGGQAPYVE